MTKQPMTSTQNLFKVIGKSVLLGSMQFAIGSVEMSSKFSVINFSKDPQTLQRAEDALNEYMLIGLVWTAGVMMIMYSNYGKLGLISGAISNILILAWIYASYKMAFKKAKLYNNL
jgi:hypothetical protein